MKRRPTYIRWIPSYRQIILYVESHINRQYVITTFTT
jgi:hypothetical protein